MGLQQFYNGDAFDLYRYFGAQPILKGRAFRVYAPAAEKVALIGDFSDWKELEMHPLEKTGIWELVVYTASIGQLYKYVIYSKEGWKCEHCDPYGRSMELRPGFATRIVDMDYEFHDYDWMQSRTPCFNRPINIYELHAGSWRTNPDDPNGWYNYEQLAEKLIPYVKEAGYTHIELMPVSEHPSDESWGYQNTGFFAPTSRYGEPVQLMRLVDLCHQAGIGVILDFVPVHFALDHYGLAKFDGSCLYEFPSDDVGYSEWGSKNFNHAKGEVASFLQSAAAYWLDVYHIDGLRMDAVSRLIYWMGDEKRGVNNRAVQFIRCMNHGLKRLFPTAMLIAEDSTAYPKVTAAVQYDGLGFDYKWDLGWMNDTLDFFKLPPWERSAHYHKLTFSMMYFYRENYLLAFSHDEVVHGKATIVQKMWGQYEEKFPQARALYLYMMTHPGKKLNFMGNEIGQLREWDEKREQDWDMRRYPNHDAFYRYICDLNRLYDTHASLWDSDFDPRSFLWLEVHGEEKCIYAYLRGGLCNRDLLTPEQQQTLWQDTAVNRTVTALNLSGAAVPGYRINLPCPMVLTPLIDTDTDIYGGNTPFSAAPIRSKQDAQGTDYIELDFAPYSGKLFQAVPELRKKELPPQKKKAVKPR